MGGITRDTVSSVMEAGCSSAVAISSLYTGQNLSANAAEFVKAIAAFEIKKTSSGNDEEGV